MIGTQKPPLGRGLRWGHPLARPLVGYWPLQERAGPRVNDLSGKGNTGTITGATWAAGKFGSCLSFDGGDYVNCGTRPGTGAAAITVAAWINRGSTQVDTATLYTVLAKTAADGADGFMLAVYTGAARFSVDDATHALAMKQGGLTLAKSRWYFVVGTYDGSVCKVYVDGVQDTGGSSTDIAGIVIPSTWDCIIGARNNGASNLWNGLIDVPLVIDRALTAAEIAQLYREPFCLFRRGPLELLVPPISAAPTVHELAGTATASGTTSGTLTVVGAVQQLATTATASATVTGNLLVRHSLSSTAAGAAAVAGNLLQKHVLSATVTASLTTTGNLTEQVAGMQELAASISVSCTVTGNLVQVHAAASTIVVGGTAGVTAGLILGASADTYSPAGNYDFAADPHCLSLYDGETWSTYLKDQKGNDDLQCYPQVNTTDYKEGAGCIEFSNDYRVSGIQYNDTTLPAGFPGKAGTGNQTVSATFWFKAHEIPSMAYVRNLIGKGNAPDGWGVEIYQSKITFYVQSWMTDLKQSDLITINNWYHVGVTYNNADRSYRIRVYDAGAGVQWVDHTGFFAADLEVTNQTFHIGLGFPVLSVNYNFDGLMDDLAIFNDVLTVDEIDACRLGTHDYGSDANCVMHWSFDSTNFLTDDKSSTAWDLVTCPTPDFTMKKTGLASMRFYGTVYEGAYRLDADLSANYPYKAGTTNLEWGICFWVRFNSLTVWQELVSKQLTSSQGSVRVYAYGSPCVITLRVRYAASSADTYSHTTSLNASTWYHIVVNVSAAANTYSISVWDDTAATEVVVAGALLHDPLVSTEPWKYGAFQLTTSTMGLDGWLDEIAQFDAPITAPKIVELRAAQTQWAVSSLSAGAAKTHAAAATLNALATMLAHIQVKQNYLPASTLEEPFPIPMLWQYQAGMAYARTDFDKAVEEWSRRISQWSEEHMIRVMRELKRLGAEKQSDWVDV